jgi:hypothetical protein
MIAQASKSVWCGGLLVSWVKTTPGFWFKESGGAAKTTLLSPIVNGPFSISRRRSRSSTLLNTPSKRTANFHANAAAVASRAAPLNNQQQKSDARFRASAAFDQGPRSLHFWRAAAR